MLILAACVLCVVCVSMRNAFLQWCPFLPYSQKLLASLLTPTYDVSVARRVALGPLASENAGAGD